MNKFYRVIAFFCLIIVSHNVSGQLAVTEGAAMKMTPLRLVQTQLVGQGISVSNARYNGLPDSVTSTQIGYFNSFGPAAAQLGINAGVIMTSGEAIIAIGPNNSPGAGASTTSGPDPDLTIIANANTND